jgi:hypothetical protein
MINPLHIYFLIVIVKVFKKMAVEFAHLLKLIINKDSIS